MKAGTPKKKREILESATREISEKGFVDARISGIAKGAGLTSSGIYLYYQNKEELLFTIIENFLVQSIEGLDEHLQGIEGAQNKLRKAIWYHCKSYSGNRSEIRIVLEARSYPRFYKSTAYTALKKYAGIITGIIDAGIQDGSFGGVSSPMILRDMILGAVDHIAINWTLKNAPDSLEQAEKIYDLVMRAASPAGNGESRPDKKAEKRARIINAATVVFAEKGFNDTSMLEIAKKAGVAEGTMYEYFGSKENLLIGIPREKLARLYEAVSGSSPEGQVRNAISRIYAFYAGEKAYATILILLLRNNRNFQRSRSSQIIENLFSVINEAIVQGQAQNLFRKDLDLDICRDLLFGTLDHILIPWIIFDRSYDLRAVSEEVADLFVKAIRV